MRVIKEIILMMGLFVFFGAVFPIMGGGTDSEAQSQFEKPHLWDYDVCVCEGPVQNGISIDCSAGDTLFAARCTTWMGLNNRRINIYRSTDGGATWYSFAYVASLAGYFTYPVVLTGSVNWKIYLFYRVSNQSGDIYMNSWTQDGTPDEFTGEVKVGADTISYFTACTDYGQGNYLMVAYQKNQMGDATPDLYTIVSTDQGETWGNEVKITEHGLHPDIAYGRDGYVYLVSERTVGIETDYEIWFTRSSDNCISWGNSEYLTDNLYDDTYAKVAALHTLPADSAYVWVAYNYQGDLRYAYSTNAGKDWSKDHILSDSGYPKAACDLWVRRGDYSSVNVCYLGVKPFHMGWVGFILYQSTSRRAPTGWTDPQGIANHPVNYTPDDGRQVCQGTYAGANHVIIYVGSDWFPDLPTYYDLFCDNSGWPTDVEEETEEGEVPTKFYLSANYPNPFNPVTSIQFSVHSPIHTTLKIYNVLGQLVKTLVDEPKERGTYEVIWDGKDENGIEVASGIYFYKLQAGDFAEAKKMLLVK